MEAELDKLREYKKLTKLRMKQAAEKLATYRVQLEEATKAIATHEATIAQQAKVITELRLEIVQLKRDKEEHGAVQALVVEEASKEELPDASSTTDLSDESGSDSSLMESSSEEEEDKEEIEVAALQITQDKEAAGKSTVEQEPPAKKQKTQDPPSEANLFLKDARSISGSKKQKAEKGLRAFYNILRDSNDKTRTADVVLPKLVTFLKKTHDIPLSIILPAFVLVVIPSFDVLVHVQVLNAIAAGQNDIRLTLAFISRHIARKNKLPIKLQVGWCRVHTVLSKQHDAMGSTHTFLVDRLLAPNRNILDFVAVAECWPHCISSLHPNKCSSTLATAIRYMIGILMQMREADDSLDIQTEPIDQMYSLSGGNLEADHKFLVDAFNSMHEATTPIFEICQSVRILVTALGWAQCQEKFPILGDIVTQLASPASTTHLVVAGVVASIFIQFPDENGAALINIAKEITQRLIATLHEGDASMKHTAAVALLDVVSHISVKSLAKEYLQPLLKWFGSQTPKEQLALENLFLRKLHQTVINLV